MQLWVGGGLRTVGRTDAVRDKLESERPPNQQSRQCQHFPPSSSGKETPNFRAVKACGPLQLVVAKKSKAIALEGR
jgi:hypothetical protein